MAARPKRWLLPAAWLLVAAPAAQALTVREAEFTCPIGGETFTQQVAMSGTQFGRDFDLKPYGPIAAPWPLPVCPGNGFVMFKQAFTEDELSVLAAYIADAEYRTLVAEDEAPYYRAAKLMAATGAQLPELAGALLQATWQADAPDRYQRYAAEALRAQRADCDGKSTQPTDAKALLRCVLLVGELQRRTRDFEGAAATFAQARAQHAAIAWEGDGAREGAYIGHLLDAQDALVVSGSSASSRLDDATMESLRKR